MSHKNDIEILHITCRMESRSDKEDGVSPVNTHSKQLQSRPYRNVIRIMSFIYMIYLFCYNIKICSGG
jgi:hypothetical protein